MTSFPSLRLVLATCLAGGVALVAAQQKPPFPPPMPAAWPPTDEKSPIPESFLKDPLVTEALAYVQATVPASILSIAPSVNTGLCAATYAADAADKNCYWPANLCVRSNDTAAFKADIFDCPTPNTWGLTYDDGPIENVVNGKHVDDTAALRDALAANNNQLATFFVVGSMGRDNPGDIAATYKAGHHVAAHTWTHWTMTSLTNEQFVGEMKYTEALIFNATGEVPRYWRPPCGDVDDRIRAIASALGYRTVIWTTTPNRDSTDADVSNTDASESQKLLSTVESWFVQGPGFISLEHDISTFTTNLAINIQNAIKAKGAAFPLKMVTIPQCINDAPYQGTASNATTTAPNNATSSSAATSATSSAASAPTATNPLGDKANSDASSTSQVSANATGVRSSSSDALSGYTGISVVALLVTLAAAALPSLV